MTLSDLIDIKWLIAAMMLWWIAYDLLKNKKKKSSLALNVFKRGEEAMDNLWRMQLNIIDKQRMSVNSEVSVPDQQQEVVTQQFCHGCGATIKEPGIHNCKYCGTLVNTVPVKDEHKNNETVMLYHVNYKTITKSDEGNNDE